MDFEEFIKECANYIEEYYDNAVTTKVIKSIKNNGHKLTGLNIIDNDSLITPTIYLDGYYFDYNHGKTFSEITTQIIRQYEDVTCPEVPDLQFFKTFEKMQEKVLLRVINFEKNLEYLSEIPHLKFLDLAITFYVAVDIKGAGNGSIVIRNEHIRAWNISVEDLYECAIKNSLKDKGVDIIKLDDILLKMMFTKECKMDYEAVNYIINAQKNDEDFCKMYVLTNAERAFGAYAILDNDKLKEVADKVDDDLFILPSSIHEIIVLPKSLGDYSDYLYEMVRSTNNMFVANDEVLSDSVYEFSREKNEVLIYV